MISLFNKKLDVKILIDEKADWIHFNPRDYEDVPYVIIEMKEFSFHHHASKCKDCKTFLESFGEESVDWYISYDSKIFRLDTERIGKSGYPQNEIKVTMSDYNPGTKMTLVFHKLPTDKEDLEVHLKSAEENEDYKKACVIRDLINE